ncbi:S8 family serine peptidase [Gemmata sp. G18]|uniref:S8 family serine peptidase n=1 Tax=Gemmata palustris TaxID=2822762 RepID=A0ABS5BQ49_9BACT|nr:S8 family serine peptidase [Gemmata palustris]MBP3955785.1 S8 family serine peptidase [Gemmata palustris]
MRSTLLAIAFVLQIAPTPALAADLSIPNWAKNRDERMPATRAAHLATLGSPDWVDAGFRGQNVKVLVLDTGFRGYRDQLGKSLPAKVTVHSGRKDRNLEFKDSQHGILVAEVVHAIAPDAELLLANWNTEEPETFLDAVKWAREQGARIITCSVVMPSWSDGEGNGPIHKRLSELLGDGTKPGDPLFFSCAGNTARRHWSGTFAPNADGFHEWTAGVSLNAISPWYDDRVALDLCWSDPGARYRLEVIDTETGKPAAGVTYREQADPPASVARFIPQSNKSFAVRVHQEKGKPGKFHLNSLASYLGETRLAGSIPFPGDGPEVVTVGAVSLDLKRASFSACGPNSPRPKPDVVAPIPFGSYTRSQPFSGTSCATPQGAASAALCISRNPEWTSAKVRGYLTDWARDLGPTGHDCETGYGLVHLPALAPAPHPRPVR